MSTHNICFRREIRKNLPDTHSYLDLTDVKNPNHKLGEMNPDICAGVRCLIPWVTQFLVRLPLGIFLL